MTVDIGTANIGKAIKRRESILSLPKGTSKGY